MDRAVALARRGLGYVEPNPAVGCVLVKAGRVVGEGWHRRFGGPHAEVEALRRAGRQAKGATAYVNLEPCCHDGKTPPCTDALIAAGVGRVVVGCVDPFEQVAGRGVAALEAAGIEVTVGVGQAESTLLNEGFLKRVLRGLPHVIAKWAATVDGAIATASGDSQWISGPRSRRLVHQLRARVDAIIIGVGTVIADDPMLTAREVTVRRVARRVVLDPDLRTPQRCKLVGSVDAAPVVIVTRRRNLTSAAAKRLERRGVEVWGAPMRGRRLDVAAMLRRLVTDHAATNVLVEGGAATLGAFLAQKQIDELMVFIAPKLLGDAAHLPAIDLPGGGRRRRIADATPLRLMSMRRVDDDVLLRYRID